MTHPLQSYGSTAIQIDSAPRESAKARRKRRENEIEHAFQGLQSPSLLRASAWDSFLSPNKLLKFISREAAKPRKREGREDKKEIEHAFEDFQSLRCFAPSRETHILKSERLLQAGGRGFLLRWISPSRA